MPISSKNQTEIAKRTKLQQAVITNADTSICVDILKSMPSYDETVHSTSSWTKNLVEPTSEEDPPSGTTDVDFELSWVHGYRCHDVRNTVKYSSAGKVVYGVASIGVIFNKSTGKQQFLQAAHKDEVIGLASHPNGQYFATGEAGPNPIIVVWSAIDGRVLARIAKAHVNGVPLLTFNRCVLSYHSFILSFDHISFKGAQYILTSFSLILSMDYLSIFLSNPSINLISLSLSFFDRYQCWQFVSFYWHG